MTKNELIIKLKIVLGIEDDTQNEKLDVEVDSALAFINSYTFRNYVFENPGEGEEVVSLNIGMVLIDFVKYQRGRDRAKTSERLSDYSVSYSQEELPKSSLRILDRYKVYNVA